MKRNARIKFSALALAVLGLFQLSLIWDGRLADYVDPRQGILVFLTGLGCVILAQVVLSTAGKRSTNTVENDGHKEDSDAEGSWKSAGLIWLVVPLMVFLLFR
ncbi:MAG: hypothetical protein A2X24_10195 [Chloroflexi bacterium GWB2_54_36]|nr:MAG: hypothetical protein A2X24_10195 [Chloroflexi bacterium GWB2_54_36]